jgi:hypothetical protein
VHLKNGGGDARQESRISLRDLDAYRAYVAEYLAERRLPEALEGYLRSWEG